MIQNLFKRRNIVFLTLQVNTYIYFPLLKNGKGILNNFKTLWKILLLLVDFGIVKSFILCKNFMLKGFFCVLILCIKGHYIIFILAFGGVNKI